MSFRDEPLRRARAYTQRHGLVLVDELGCGVHGIVFATTSQHEEGEPVVHAALKAHQQEAYYLRERDVYLRLQVNEVEAVRGCHVPQLLHYDDGLWVIEMTVVKRPFVLDFAGAVLDEPPDFSEEVLADWRVEKQEQFGERWAEVQAVLRELEGFGVFMLDVNPGNVAFDD